MPEEIIMLEDLEGIVDNKYLAVNIAARRARHLNEGDRAVIETDAVKPSTIALQELVQNRLAYRVQHTRSAHDRPFELEDTLLDDEEPLLEEEYIDDTDLILDDDEPEEGL